MGKVEYAKYSPEEFIAAYKIWADGMPGERQIAWDRYCDMRDGFVLGTHTKIRIDHEKRMSYQAQQTSSFSTPSADLKIPI